MLLPTAFALSSFLVIAPVSAQEELSAIYTLEVNRVTKGDVIVVVRGNDVLIPVQDLLNAGLREIGGRREIIQGLEHVSLQSLAPAITFQRDDANLVLGLQVGAAQLPETVIDFNPTNEPPGIRYSQPLSAYLNYGIFWDNFERLTAASEAVISFGGNALTSTLGLTADGKLQRGLTAFTFDNRQRLTTLTLGDAFIRSDALGGGGLWGGVVWQRNFGLSPYLIRQPTVEFRGEVTTPSNVKVYLNNVPIREVTVPPGPLIVKNLPAFGGFNQLRIVATDADGNQRVFRRNFVRSFPLLRPGLSEFIVAAGAERKNLSTENFSYGDQGQFLAAYRQGILNNLTLGARLEGNGNLLNAGLNLSTAIPIGTLDVAAAISTTEGKLGSGVAVSYNYPGRRLAFGGGMRLLSGNYVNTGLALADDRPQLEGFANATLSLSPRVTISGQYVFSNPRDQVARQQATILAQVQLRRNLSLYLQGSRLFSGSYPPVDQFSVTFNYFLNNAVTINTGWQQQGNQGVPFLSVSKSLPTGVGYGYQGELRQVNNQVVADGSFFYNAPWGRYQIGYRQSGTTGKAQVVAEGGLVAIGGEVFATRPIQGSFALVDVPNVAGVRTYLSNQEIGRTNRRGKLLIPNLLPYYGNALRIEDEDIPIDFAIGRTELLIAPPFRGGAIARFDVRPSRNYVGRVVILRGSERIIPNLGQLTLERNKEKIVSPLSPKGEFYFDTLEAGTYTAEVAYEQLRCTFQLTLPPSDDLFTDVGEVSCSLPDSPR
ncbi:fimbria/pilus outer membrane usher protein [Thermosynechococcus sp.]|uniref:fimbria/pilus outer membrane usher protein n=1 Tax=Thermosynechococcus sp. TaxID=2814275 RepID=UPI00391C801F